MKQILTDIQARLAAKVTDFKYIAQDWGQLDLYADHPPVRFPCALVDITDGQFDNVGHKVQEARLLIAITIVDFSNRISSKGPKDMKDRALDIFDLMTAVHKALQGWTGGQSYAPLVRETMGRTVREDGARLRTLVFSTTWWDDSADDRAYAKANKVAVTPGIK